MTSVNEMCGIQNSSKEENFSYFDQIQLDSIDPIIEPNDHPNGKPIPTKHL